MLDQTLADIVLLVEFQSNGNVKVQTKMSQLDTVLALLHLALESATKLKENQGPIIRA